MLLGLLREWQPKLYHHLRQVGRMAALIGRRLEMDDEQLDELRRAAELHDIGKAAIPDRILNKPGLLDDEEWNLMRRHTVIAERVLGAAPAMVVVASTVRSCQERWDGSGYPDGLSGEEIPLAARVIFVCDAFDAMMRDRPYARARSYDEAITELKAAAGTQFDPEVVEVFEVVWRELAEAEEVSVPAARAEPAPAS